MVCQTVSSLLTHWQVKVFAKAKIVAVVALALVGTAALVTMKPSYGTASPSDAWRDSLNRPTEMNLRALKAAMLGIARAGARIVSVGERGVILISDDDGRTWRQTRSPVSVTLTAVQFVDDRRGWAVGHAGVVLATEDAGTTWTVQLDGMRAASLVFAAAEEAAAHGAAKASQAEQALVNASQLVKDGADKPFLDLYFRDANTGYIVGAYGLFLLTSDGGKTWASAIERIDAHKAVHFNAIAGRGDEIVIVGERGTVLRSLDAGNHFVELEAPTKNSFFAVEILEDGAIILGGLRGQGFVLSAKQEWVPVDLPTIAALTILTQNGERIVIGDQRGSLFESRNGGRNFTPIGKGPARDSVRSVWTADGGLIIAGLQGLRRIDSSPKQ